MNMIRSLASEIDAQIEVFLEAATQAVALTPKKVSTLGLLENSTQVNQGDLIVDAGAGTVYVATGQMHGGKPIVVNKQGRKTLEPEFIVVGAMARTPSMKRIAGRVAMKYPNRRVLVYGDAELNSQDQENSNAMVESLISTLIKDRSKNNPVADDSLPAQDKGIVPTSLKAYMDAMKDKDKTSKGSSVKNDPDSWTSFIDASKQRKWQEPGDSNPGNGCPGDSE